MFQQLFRAAEPVELELETRASLGQLDRSEWDRITERCGLYLSYPFLRSVEESTSTQCAYLLLRDRKGALVAGLPTYRWNGAPDPGLDHYEPFAAGARWVLGSAAQARPWLPTLIAGTRSGYATEFAVDPSWDRSRTSVISGLLRATAQLAERSEVASLGLMWLTSAAARELVDHLTRPEYLLLAGPNCAIDIAWRSFEEYLAQLSYSRRRSARRERERFQKSGLQVQFSDLYSSVDEIAPLAASLQRKYGHALRAREIAEQLQAQVRHLNSASRVLLCRRQGRLVGFSLLYRWGGVLYGRLAGFDYRATVDTDAYFNLAFYPPLQLALDEGLDRLHLGMATWRAKTLRGASLDPAWTLACPPGSVRGPWCRVVRAQGEGPGKWWAEQFPRQVDWKADWRWTRAGLAGNMPATTNLQ
ncbi:MAG: GNAT family N-acetyltransferase [Candidatus Dormibacteria bacterium]